MSREYQKIPGPFRREVEGPRRNRIIDGAWSTPELEQTADLEWSWTEKVDGTNIRLHWDGHRIAYGGRTDDAQIPTKLLTVLQDLVSEEMLEQKFGAEPVTLYGEGYGAGIQRGGVYRPDMSFVLFDVRIGDWWLLRENVLDVGRALGLDVVPEVLVGTIRQAIDWVWNEVRSSWFDGPAEGLVGVTTSGLRTRNGDRLIVKVKAKDFGPKVYAHD